MNFEQYLIESELDDLKKELKDSDSYLKAPNGKKSNLTQRQWLIVRTKAFKNWFGDWENDKKNSSKVIDENGEPLIVYHGTSSEFSKFEVDRSGDHGFNFGKLIFFTNDSKVASGYAVRLSNSEELADANKKLDKHWENVRLALVANNFDVKNDAVVKARAEWDKQSKVKNKVFDDIFDFKIITSGAIVMNGFVNIRKPYVVNGDGKGWRDVHEDAFETFHNDGSYDGVIIKNVIDSASTNTQYPCNIYAFPKPNQVKSALGNSGTFKTDSDDIHESIE